MRGGVGRRRALGGLRIGKQAVTALAAAPANLMQLFLRDPVGNLIELHQIGRCRCKRSDRLFADAKAAAGAAPTQTAPQD